MAKNNKINKDTNKDKDKEEQKYTWKKILSSVFNVVLGLLLVVVVYCQISITVTSKKNGIPSCFGVSFMRVVTDSMVGDKPDSLPVGTAVIVDNVSPEDIVVGDVISFHSQINGYNVVITHRVKEIEDDPNRPGKLIFQCTGDNLFAQTCPAGGCSESYRDHVRQKDYIGKVVGHSDALGKTLELMSPQAAKQAGTIPWLFPVSVLVPMFLLTLINVGDTIRQFNKEELAEENHYRELANEKGIEFSNDEEFYAFMEKERYKQEFRDEIEAEKKKEKKRLKKELKKQNRKKK